MISLFIPSLPGLNTSTRRRHWSQQHKEAVQWESLVWAEMAMAGQEKPTEPWEKVRCRLTRCSSRQPDYDNLVASFKVVLDSLVKNSVLADDRPQNFTDGHPEYVWKKGSRGVRIELWDV